MVVAVQGTTVAQPDDGVTSQGTTATPLLKQRGLLQGSGGVGAGAGSTKAAAAWPVDGGLGSGLDGPRSGLESFFILEN
jgi:hypothetical protein